VHKGNGSIELRLHGGVAGGGKGDVAEGFGRRVIVSLSVERLHSYGAEAKGGGDEELHWINLESQAMCSCVLAGDHDTARTRMGVDWLI